MSTATATDTDTASVESTVVGDAMASSKRYKARSIEARLDYQIQVAYAHDAYLDNDPESKGHLFSVDVDFLDIFKDDEIWLDDRSSTSLENQLADELEFIANKFSELADKIRLRDRSKVGIQDSTKTTQTVTVDFHEEDKNTGLLIRQNGKPTRLIAGFHDDQIREIHEYLRDDEVSTGHSYEFIDLCGKLSMEV